MSPPSPATTVSVTALTDSLSPSWLIKRQQATHDTGGIFRGKILNLQKKHNLQKTHNREFFQQATTLQKPLSSTQTQLNKPIKNNHFHHHD